jgi:hypothetical protein
MTTTIKDYLLWVDGVIGGGLLVGLPDGRLKVLAGVTCLLVAMYFWIWREKK